MEKIKVFDRMSEYGVREMFCERKGRHLGPVNDYDELKAYILSDECTDDILRLKRGEYYIGVPNRFKIRKLNSNRRRVCYSYPGKDNYLLKLMAYVLMEYDYIFTESLYSFRRNKDHRDFFKRLKKVDFGRQLFVLKMDVHSYGESVDQDILLDKLDPIFEDDPEFKAFLHWILKRNQYYEKGQLHNERISIIQGTPIGAFLNNVYLMEMDKYVEAHSKLYMRFADDIAVFTDSYDEAVRMKEYILEEMKRHKLECNPDKTFIFKPGEKFSILGIEVAENSYDIAPESVRKVLYKIKRKQGRLLYLIRRKEITNETAFEIAMRFTNRFLYGTGRENGELNWTSWAFGIITKTDTLKLLDHSIQDMLRSTKSGKSGKARFRTDYGELNEAGYKSLVYSYYHHNECERNSADEPLYVERME